MADTAVLKEFLVQLGFKIDEPSGSKFTNTIIKATAEITAFATAVEGAAALVISRVSAMADQLEDLYFAAQRTGASAENIRTFGFAAERLGSSVGAARGSLEAFRAFLGSSPASGGLLRSIGIDPTQDPTRALEQFGDYLKTLPEYLQRLRAEQFGLDWHTALALMSGDFQLIQSDADATFKRLGINLEQATRDSHTFNTQLAFLGNTFEALKVRVVEVLQQRLSVDIQRFRELLEANFDRIAHVIDVVTKAILWAGDVLFQVVGKVAQVFNNISDWYTQLSPQTKEMIKDVALLAAGFYILNRVLNTNPFVLLLTGFALLIDDYMSWKKGGAHVIDWDVWAPEIQKAYEAFKTLAEWINTLVKGTIGWKSVAEVFLAYMAGAWLAKLTGVFLGAAGATAPFLSKLGLILAVAEAVNLALGLLDPKDKFGSAVDKYVPGAAWFDDFMKRHTGFGRSYAEQSDAAKDGKPAPQDQQAKPQGEQQSYVGQLWHSFADYFWGVGSGAGNWMRDSFDKLVDTSGKMLAAIEKALIPSAEAAEPDVAPGTAGVVPDMGNYLPGGGGGGTSRGGGAGGPALPTRLNNPLALTVAPNMMGRVPSQGRFRQFDSMASGYQAAIEQLQIYNRQGLFTITDIIKKWAPPGENNTAAYISAVAGRMGMGPNEVLDLYDSATMYKLAAAMAQQEDSAGFSKNEPMERKAIWQALGKEGYNLPSLTPPATGQPIPTVGIGVAGSGVPSNLRIDSTINVHGVQDPQMVADRVMQEYDRHNLEAIRNAQSAVR